MASSVAAASGSGAKHLRGSEKAAALLLFMGKPLASRLLSQFDSDELKLITRSIAELGTVSAPTLEILVEEFARQFANGVDLLGSPDEVQQMLDGVLPPEQIADVMSDLTGNSNQGMWDRLSNVPESVFAGFLVKEYFWGS
jgi:flagellar motor switch protein FliG